MSTRSIATGVLLAVMAGGAANAAPAAAQTDADAPQHQLSATAGGAAVKALLFTYCRSISDPQGTGTGTGVCADGYPVATATRLAVRGGSVVTIAIAAPVTSIAVRYAAADGTPAPAALAVRALDASRRHYAVALPATRPLPLLLISTTYRDLPRADGGSESGDAHFSVGLAERRVVRRAPSAVTARAQVSCRIEESGERRCRLNESGTIRRRSPRAGDCSGGRVRVRVIARGGPVMQVTVPATALCRHRVDNRFFVLAPGVTTLRVVTRFLGSARLAGRNAATIRINLR
jgi:hypothetical protein